MLNVLGLVAIILICRQYSDDPDQPQRHALRDPRAPKLSEVRLLSTITLPVIVARTSITNPSDTIDAPLLDEAAGATVSVLIHDAEANPIGGSLVSTYATDGRVVLGTTGADGVVSAPRARVAGRTLSVVSTGFVSVSRYLGTGISDALSVRLARGAAIHGQLVMPTGKPVGAGVRVLAWPSTTEFPGPDLLPLIHLETTPPRSAATDEEGTFEISGLDPSLYYFLVAGGAGYIRPRYYGEVFAPAEELIQVEVSALYGMAIDVSLPETRQGEEPADLGQMTSLMTESMSFRGDHSALVDPRSIGAGLAGLIVPDESTSVRRYVLFADARDQDDVGPAEVSFTTPGYEAVRFASYMPRIRNSVQRRCITLVSTAGKRGAILLVPINDSAFVEPAQGRHTPLAIAQIGPFGDGEGVDFPIPAPFSEPFQIAGLPQGPCRLRILFWNGKFQIPQGDGEWIECTVGDQPTCVEIDMSLLGAIELLAVDQHGFPYDGEIRLTIGDGRPIPRDNGAMEISGGRGGVGFRHGPYLLRGLSPGLYTIVVGLPLMPGMRALDSAVEVVVEPGEIIRATVTVSSDDQIEEVSASGFRSPDIR